MSLKTRLERLECFTEPEPSFVFIYRMAGSRPYTEAELDAVLEAHPAPCVFLRWNGEEFEPMRAET